MGLNKMIDAKTKLMGLFGYPLGHSFSPLMHNKLIAKLGLNYVFLPFEIKPGNLAPALESIRALDMLGVNVTIPYKEKVIEHLDGLSPDAQACGAVNLIKNEKGKLIGYNTDGAGFVAGLKAANIDVAGDVILLGAGGAARAVAYALAQEGIKSMAIFDLDKSKASNLVNFITEKTSTIGSSYDIGQENFDKLASKAKMIINCTPVGMYPHVDESPIVNISQVKEALLCDLIYNPLKTKFLAMGEKKGLATMNGLPMLIHQGALTFNILTGQQAPIDFMEDVILNQM